MLMSIIGYRFTFICLYGPRETDYGHRGLNLGVPGRTKTFKKKTVQVQPKTQPY